MTALDILRPDGAPDYLQDDIAKFLLIAKGHGVNCEKLNLQHCKHMMKGYWELVRKQTNEEVAA
jgi:hypothetical protein